MMINEPVCITCQTHLSDKKRLIVFQGIFGIFMTVVRKSPKPVRLTLAIYEKILNAHLTLIYKVLVLQMSFH